MSRETWPKQDLRKVDLTDEDIKETVDEYNKYELKTYGKEAARVLKVEDYTCHECEAKRYCNLSFDPYNTDGDCLQSK